jgi:hypothetical protein
MAQDPTFRRIGGEVADFVFQKPENGADRVIDKIFALLVDLLDDIAAVLPAFPFQAIDKEDGIRCILHPADQGKEIGIGRFLGVDGEDRLPRTVQALFEFPFGTDADKFGLIDGKQHRWALPHDGQSNFMEQEIHLFRKGRILREIDAGGFIAHLAISVALDGYRTSFHCRDIPVWRGVEGAV